MAKQCGLLASPRATFKMMSTNSVERSHFSNHLGWYDLSTIVLERLYAAPIAESLMLIGLLD